MTVSQEKLTALVAKFSTSAIGADDPAKYIPRGVTAADCTEMATVISHLLEENARLIAEMQRRDDNENHHCLNTGPCSRMNDRRQPNGIK